MKEQYKKESPVLSLLGMGGGGTGTALGGVTKQLKYVDDTFSTYLYEGNGGTKTINNGIDLAGEGGLVWFKKRNAATYGGLWDTERGVTKRLRSDTTDAEATASNLVTSFNSNGVSISATGGTQINNNNDDYVSWTFRKAPGFFDVVTWTGNGVQGRQISHSLGSVPGMIIIKSTSDASSPVVYHRSLGIGQNLTLNEMYATNAVAYVTSVSSTTFGISQQGQTNLLNSTYVAYVFAHDDQSFGTDEDESIIKCGSYVGNSTGANLRVNVGFEPQFVLIKNTSPTPSFSAAGDWYILDSMRGAANDDTDQPLLQPNNANAETSPNGGGLRLFVTNEGFGTNNQTGDNINGNGNTYVYMAIRRPHKPPEAGTEVFAMDAGNGSSKTPTWDSGFPVDLAFYANEFSTRLTGRKYLQSYNLNAEASNGNLSWDSNAGWGKAFSGSVPSYMLRRAPGFMDVVTYSGTVTGNSGSQTVPHNLGVTPELMIVKRRSGGADWTVYSNALTPPLLKKLKLNEPDGESDSSSASSNDWGPNSSPTAPNANNFTVGYSTATGWVTAGDFIAYLFATLPGISKVGSYSGNSGYAVNVPCGFTNGARFIMIKRIDGSGNAGDWYYWDTYRGIGSGNDSYRRFNIDQQEVTNTDYVDPLTSGFTVTASAPAALNASGGTYLFLAIA